ncbi:glutaredoxin 3 [Candidatus Gracilibacteria bacterium]|nr:glutaredoxin 3 [Candidatus Gracilibacteria bacterium]
MKKITIYSKDNCPYCILAKNLLTSLGAIYEAVDVTNNHELLMEIVAKSRMRTLPQIFLGDECLGGYTDIAALHDRGELVEKIGL